LDFADVDWNQGNYFIKAFVNGDAVGASQIKSVPFALIADGIRGVLTKRQLIGTWKVNNLGFITFNVTKASPYTGEVGKYVMFSVYDKDGMSFKILKTEYKN